MSPCLQTPHTVLRTIDKSDYPLLHRWHTQVDEMHLWHVDRRLLSFASFEEDFDKQLRRSIDVFLLVQNKATGQPMGMVYTYGTCQVDGYSYLCAYFEADFRQKQFASQAITTFVHYLFANCALRKLYAEIFEYNHKVLRLARMRGFREEACLREHRYFNGKYWHLYQLALYRDAFLHRFA